MDDYVQLSGSDITHHLQHARGCGVTRGASSDGVQTVELTTNPALHGSHGRLNIQSFLERPVACSVPSTPTDRQPSPLPALTADLRLQDALLRGMSDDSIRFWGNFGPEAELFIASDQVVRVVVRALDGTVLAGPTWFAPDMSRVAVTW